MAGQPKMKALTERVTKLGGEDWLFAKIVDGVTVKALLEQINTRSESFSAYQFFMWIKKDETRNAAYKEARKMAAHTHADSALEIAEATSEDTAKGDRIKIGTKQWLAERFNREEYGQAPAVQNTITINQLHLDALRAPLNAAQELARQQQRARIDAIVEDITDHHVPTPKQLASSA